MQIPMPANEVERVAALRSYQILDTPPEAAYDEITELAADACQCPLAIIGMMDERREWLKAKYGLPPELTEVPREMNMCATTVCGSDILIVPDLRADERFSQYPVVVGAPHLRFYCGMPLISPDGYALGTLCVFDLEPREMRFEQAEAVRPGISRQVRLA